MKRKTQRQMAEEFISRLKKMAPDDIRDMVLQDMGPELKEFMGRYATEKMATKLKVNTGVILMFIGYLARANEERENAKEYNYTASPSRISA